MPSLVVLEQDFTLQPAGELIKIQGPRLCTEWGTLGAEQTYILKSERDYKQATIVPCLGVYWCTRILRCYPCGAKNIKRPGNEVEKAQALESGL